MYVFRWRGKVDGDGAEVSSSGKLFQTLAPAYIVELYLCMHCISITCIFISYFICN